MPRRLEFVPEIAALTPLARPSACWPDRFRPNLKRAKQPGQFALTQFARQTIIIWTTPFASNAVIESE
jgi:hypothetical protein